MSTNIWGWLKLGDNDGGGRLSIGPRKKTIMTAFRERGRGCELRTYILKGFVKVNCRNDTPSPHQHSLFGEMRAFQQLNNVEDVVGPALDQ